MGVEVEMEMEMEELERIQRRILERIAKLELQLSSSDDAASDPTAERLSGILRSNAVTDFKFKVVPSDYYERSLEARRDLLSAPSIHHLCKSIVLVNTQAQSDVVDCSNRYNSKYYVVVVQYTARFNAETVKNYLYALNQGKVPKKKFNLRLAPEEISNNLTGFEHNAVTCIGMKTDIPLVGYCQCASSIKIQV
ncbi:uncharacterized protein LOC110732767 isoform X2 [Chenopodium quinoa]|uniref:uncharacterized protein LOC110732767 isoform X2 n=1 Tax=Chenopodium quinoa TaxID=63459 RepID=UPI000B777EBF|nr:uncharacterized protein LOC110732767 isoform X2 [Chenopodium quinoa]